MLKDLAPLIVLIGLCLFQRHNAVRAKAMRDDWFAWAAFAAALLVFVNNLLFYVEAFSIYGPFAIPASTSAAYQFEWHNRHWQAYFAGIVAIGFSFRLNRQLKLIQLELDGSQKL